MEYIGWEDRPAPLMKDVELEEPQEVYDTLTRYMKLAYQEAELVHGDLSEFNVLMFEGEPVIIDCGQAVLTDHPNALDLLRRDVVNINRFFRRLGVEVNECLVEEIVGG